MKQIFISGILIVLSSVFACNFQSASSVAAVSQNETNQTTEHFDLGDKQPVLIELFTSEGCLSCPPADKVLASLEKEQPVAHAEIIALSLHVDYWDSPSWKDNYSSQMFSRRQDIYSARLRGDNYTPQMIVDGQSAFVGSDAAKAQKAILEALKMPKAKIELIQTQDKLKIKISGAPAHQNATVFLAIAEDNLAPSNVSGGENSGRKLFHTSVVRELKSLGMFTSEQKNLELENTVQILPAWKKENLKFVVFLQENASRKIFGAAKKSAE